MLKKDELRRNDSCLNKAADDEPVFVLRAKDPLAAHIVEEWANLAASLEMHEPEKISQAMQDANDMRQWRKDQIPF